MSSEELELRGSNSVIIHNNICRSGTKKERNKQTFDFDMAWVTPSILDENPKATHTGFELWLNDEHIFLIQ
jgi:hypothetical protein